MADLQRVAGFWRERVEAESAAQDDRLRAGRRLHASVTFAGMVRLDGDLDPETGETLLTALGAVLDDEARARTQEDDRSPSQRRADALGEICRQWLDRADRPQVGAERPHVSMTVGLEALTGEGGAAELDHAGVVRARIAQRLACDATIQRVVLSPRSEPLDVGRRTRSCHPPCGVP